MAFATTSIPNVFLPNYGLYYKEKIELSKEGRAGRFCTLSASGGFDRLSHRRYFFPRLVMVSFMRAISASTPAEKDAHSSFAEICMAVR